MSQLRRRASCSVFWQAILAVGFILTHLGQEAPVETALWGDRLSDNPIHYAEGETVRSPEASETSPSGLNRVFSRVETPTYVIHQAPEAIANGVGLVICPGGGYVDVWLDREGHDLGIWLASRGITSLVLKYRTNSRADEKERRYDWDTYLPAVVSDAWESVALLRRRAGAHRQHSARRGLSDRRGVIGRRSDARRVEATWLQPGQPRMR